MRHQVLMMIAAVALAALAVGCADDASDNDNSGEMMVPDMGDDEPDDDDGDDDDDDDDEPDPEPRLVLTTLPEVEQWDTDTIAAMDHVVEGASVVGLGEATHGSGGLHQARAVMIRRLVEVHGARAFFMESPWLQARAANDYVAACAGSPQDATASFFYYIWFDAALQETLEWFCDWNRDNPQDPVFVGGVDVQNPFDDVTGLEQWLPQLTDTADEIIEGLRQCPFATFTDVHDALQRPSEDVVDARTCRQGLDALEDVLASADPSEETSLAQLAWRSLAAWLDINNAPSNPALLTARDTAMADLLEAQWSQDALAIVYMANSHISRAHPDVKGTALEAYNLEGGQSTGTVLAQRLGDRYVAIATTARILGVNRKGTPPERNNRGSLAASLYATGIDAGAILLDLGAENSETWGQADTQMVMFGALRALVPQEQFDAVLALERSEPMIDAVAQAYDGPYREERAGFEPVDQSRHRQGNYIGVIFDDEQGWELFVRYQEPFQPVSGAPIDMSAGNTLELILSGEGRFWFAVAGQVTITEDGGAGQTLAVEGQGLVFWPLYRNQWLIPGPEAIHIESVDVSGSMGF